MRDAPILLAHVEQDPVVPLQIGELSRGAQRVAGYAVDWRTYPMPHTLCAPVVAAIAAFLGRVLGEA